jgi:hypothetical protein
MAAARPAGSYAAANSDSESNCPGLGLLLAQGAPVLQETTHAMQVTSHH